LNVEHERRISKEDEYYFHNHAKNIIRNLTKETKREKTRKTKNEKKEKDEEGY